MRHEYIKTLWAEAKDIHQQMREDDRPSIEALFLALSGPPKEKRSYRMADATSPPSWFVDGLAQLGPISGTAAEFYALVCYPKNGDSAPPNGVAPSVTEAKQCGQWLRQLGYTSGKSNGRMIFRPKT